MKKLYAIILPLLFIASYVNAGCNANQVGIHISITPDNYPQEIHWSLRDAVTNQLIDTGNSTGSFICVSSTRCLKFTIFDNAGDGICCGYGNGSYTVTMNGNLVASGGDYNYSETTTFNCPAGYQCNNPLLAVTDTMTAPSPETWYVFIADSNGMYTISTCALGNTCDTKLYVYDQCAGIVPEEGNQGTTFYNDDNCANNQAQISAALEAGHTYYIRIGDYNTSCSGQSINWLIDYVGPITGCMDPASCNYNPLATVADSSCVYPPNVLCPAPDLVIMEPELANSMYRDNENAANGDCFVAEGCLAGYGNRELIRFTTHIKNIGELDYFIGAPDTVGNQFVYDQCHNHWHYAGYAEYLLYNANNQPMQSGFKNGFCVLDLECSGGGQGKYSCGYMGITAGCGDIYDAGLDCQWIDITDVDTGLYTLVVRVNWDHSPDKLGRYEKTYDNNWGQVCFRLFYDNNGYKDFAIQQTCVPYVDCANDTFGNAQLDCAAVCNGSSVHGDVNLSHTADEADVHMYLNGLKEDSLIYSPCLDLNGDSTLTVTDVARLNGCLLFNDSTHHHTGQYQNTHKHCEFPFNLFNPFDTATFSIANVNWQSKYVDLSILNPSSLILAYELQMHGLLVDSVKNLAIGNYAPDIRASSDGHIVTISKDENALFKQTAPLHFLRIYYSALTDTVVCIEKIIATVNSNYEEAVGLIGGSCAVRPLVTGVQEVELNAADVTIMPNPNNGQFDLYLNNTSLQNTEIKVSDALGRIVYSTTNNNAINKLTINMPDAQVGIYLLHLNVNGKAISKRVIVSAQ